MKKEILIIATALSLSGTAKASDQKNLPWWENCPTKEVAITKERDHSNNAWEKKLGPNWEIFDNINLSSTDTLTLITHPLWGFISDKTYKNPTHITSLWFKYIEGKKGVDFANEFKIFLVKYIKEISQKKHISVLDKKNLFYIFENIHLVEALKTRTSPRNKNIFILPKHKTGKNNPNKKEFQQYSEILKSMLSNVPNKYFTSSQEWGNGYLHDKDVDELGAFAIKKTIVLTGGYTEACLNNTRVSLIININNNSPLSLDTITAVHAPREISNREIDFFPEEWNKILKNVRDNPHYNFSDLKNATNSLSWQKISRSFDSKTLKVMQKQRNHGYPSLIRGTHL